MAFISIHEPIVSIPAVNLAVPKRLVAMGPR